DRPITMVVAFPPGGADDAIARILHDPMEKALGQSRQLSFHTWGNSGLEPYSGSGNRLSSNRQDPPRDLSLKLTAICINTGGFEVYDISNNLITNAAFLGAVGLDWQVMGFGNFSSAGENDMILRNSSTGGVEVYDIRNNQITGAAFLGTVGLNWQFSGVGNFSSLGESDMLLRNSNTGGLEVYDIANSQITNAAFIGTVG